MPVAGGRFGFSLALAQGLIGFARHLWVEHQNGIDVAVMTFTFMGFLLKAVVLLGVWSEIVLRL